MDALVIIVSAWFRNHNLSLSLRAWKSTSFSPESPLKKNLGTAALHGPIAEAKLQTSSTWSSTRFHEAENIVARFDKLIKILYTVALLKVIILLCQCVKINQFILISKKAIFWHLDWFLHTDEAKKRISFQTLLGADCGELVDLNFFPVKIPNVKYVVSYPYYLKILIKSIKHGLSYSLKRDQKSISKISFVPGFVLIQNFDNFSKTLFVIQIWIIFAKIRSFEWRLFLFYKYNAVSIGIIKTQGTNVILEIGLKSHLRL